MPGLSSFSILERIDDVVTGLEGDTYSVSIDFQYPRTDRRCCDLVLLSPLWRLTLSFSILERIDDVVTSFRAWRDVGYSIFQYPRTDRRCCDRAERLRCRTRATSFSILERIDDVVTTNPSTILASDASLSVSSNGSTML